MKINELIARLIEAQAKVGDVDVVMGIDHPDWVSDTHKVVPDHAVKGEVNGKFTDDKIPVVMIWGNSYGRETHPDIET